MRLIEISIIVPVYNVKQYLAECLDSLVNQTFDRYEIILVNDGSTDGSEEICREYAFKYERIKLIEQENMGLSVARNNGILAAEGNYILFVDSDDYVALNICEAVYAVIEIQNVDVVIFDTYIIYDKTVVTDSTDINAVDKDRILTQSEHISLFFKSFMHVAACRRLYKKSLFTENGFFFPVGRVYEEIVNTTKITINAESAYVMSNSFFYYYRNRVGSIVNRIDLKTTEDAFYAAKFRINTVFQVSDEILTIDEKKAYFNKCFARIFKMYKDYQNNAHYYMDVSGGYNRDKKYIIYGASEAGIQFFLQFHGSIDVLYFADNDKNKHGKKIFNTIVVSTESLRKIYDQEKHQIVICSVYFLEIANQLMRMNIISTLNELFPYRGAARLEAIFFTGFTELLMSYKSSFKM